MCWISTFSPKKEIASEDIIVYKLLEEYSELSYRSYFMNILYEFNHLYTENEPKIEEISEGFKIGRGLHSYSSINNPILIPCLFNPDATLFKAIIPKGAIYYKNEYGEVVSNQLIVTNEIIKRTS